MTEIQLPPSLWAATAPPAPTLPTLQGHRDATVAIVGAGVLGLSTALHLAERGVSVAVVEAGDIGAGASGRNNGQVIPHYTAYGPADIVERFGHDQGERLNDLVRDSASFTFDLVRRYNIACDAVQNGWFQPAHTPHLVSRAQRLADQWGARDADVTFIDREQTAALLGNDDYFGAWSTRTGGHLNPLAYTRGLAAAAQEAGAHVYIHSPALRLAAVESGWRLDCRSGTIDCEKVLLATNAYTDDLWPSLKRTVVPVRVYQVATQPLGDNVRRTLLADNQAMSDSRRVLRFLRYDRDGRLVTGGGFSVWHNAEARARRERAVFLQQMFPQLPEVQIDYYWSGLIGVTPDRLPRLYQLGNDVTALLGWSGRGVAFATAMGKPLASYLSGFSDTAELPLPLDTPQPIRGHSVAGLVSRLMKPIYQWQDRRA